MAPSSELAGPQEQPPQSTPHIRTSPDVNKGVRPFEEVVNDHSAAVLRICRALVGPDRAEDAWSETFLAALRAYPRLDAKANVRAWLLTIARNKAIDELRRSRRQIPTDPLPERPSPSRVGDWRSDLHEALSALTERQRTAVVGHHLAGLPYVEIAEILHCTPAAARRAGADGLAALRLSYQEST